MTMCLSCTVREIWCLKDNGVTTLTFWGHVTSSVMPMLKAKSSLRMRRVTAHVPCHVTCRQGVQNNRIFGILEATLPIHYATLVGLR